MRVLQRSLAIRANATAGPAGMDARSRAEINSHRGGGSRGGGRVLFVAAAVAVFNDVVGMPSFATAVVDVVRR